MPKRKIIDKSPKSPPRKLRIKRQPQEELLLSPQGMQRYIDEKFKNMVGDLETIFQDVHVISIVLFDLMNSVEMAEAHSTNVSAKATLEELLEQLRITLSNVPNLSRYTEIAQEARERRGLPGNGDDEVEDMVDEEISLTATLPGHFSRQALASAIFGNRPPPNVGEDEIEDDAVMEAVTRMEEEIDEIEEDDAPRRRRQPRFRNPASRRRR